LLLGLGPIFAMRFRAWKELSFVQRMRISFEQSNPNSRWGKANKALQQTRDSVLRNG
jgi:hypothetical protein